MVKNINIQKSIGGQLGKMGSQKDYCWSRKLLQISNLCFFCYLVNLSGTHVSSFLTFFNCQMCLKIVDIETSKFSNCESKICFTVSFNMLRAGMSPSAFLILKTCLSGEKICKSLIYGILWCTLLALFLDYFLIS